MNAEIRSLGSVRARGILLLIVVALAAGTAGGAIERVWVSRLVRREEGARTDWVAARGENGLRVLSPGDPGPIRVQRSPEDRRRVEGRAEEGGIPLSLQSVNLTEAQRVRILAITQKRKPAAESLMQRISELDLKMRQEAMCVLTPRQRDEWMAWRRRERLSMEEGQALLKLVTANSCATAGGAAP